MSFPSLSDLLWHAAAPLVIAICGPILVAIGVFALRGRGGSKKLLLDMVLSGVSSLVGTFLVLIFGSPLLLIDEVRRLRLPGPFGPGPLKFLPVLGAVGVSLFLATLAFRLQTPPAPSDDAPDGAAG